MLYEKTHIHSTIAVHSRELQKDVTENIETKATEDKELIFMGYDASKKTKRAQMSFKHWDNFIKDVYLFLKNKNINVKNFVEENENSFVIKSSGNKDGALNVISEDINKQIQELFDNFAEGTVSRSQLVRQKVEILEQINNTAMKSYENALAVGLQTVATALSKSDKDGDKSEHPKALDKLESLARRIWENHIVKKINL